MSFYAKIETELSDKKFVICALEELKNRGEITNFRINKVKNVIEVNRDGDMINITQTKTGNFQLAGNARIVRIFSKRLKQFYAYASIKEQLPFDFEIAQESEVAGDIMILLKG